MKSLAKTPPPKRDPKAWGFSDFLPPAMVKDLRQSLRSPIHVVMLLLGIALMYLFIEPTSGYYESQRIANWDVFIGFAAFLLIVFVPIHSSRTIAGDIRERGSNFLLLCPISAGRIIMGQFLSGAAQLLLLVLALGPLTHRFQATASHYFSWCIEYGPFEIPAFYVCSLSVLMLYLIALFALAVMMLLASIPLFFRLMTLAGIASLLLIVQEEGHYLFNREHYLMPHSIEMLDSWLILAVLLVVGTICALQLAKRHYCAFVEVRSGSLRLVSSLLIFAPLFLRWVAYHDMPIIEYAMMTKLAAMGTMLWLLIDELMPRDILSPSTQRPFLLNRCSSLATISSMALILGLSCILPALMHALGLFSICSPAELSDASSSLCFSMLSLFASLVFCLALVDTFLKPTSRARLTAFLVAMLVVTIFSFQLELACESLVKDDFTMSFLPFVHFAKLDYVPTNTDFVNGVIFAVCALFYSLLVILVRHRSSLR